LSSIAIHIVAIDGLAHQWLSTLYLLDLGHLLLEQQVAANIVGLEPLSHLVLWHRHGGRWLLQSHLLGSAEDILLATASGTPFHEL
jgi:hypothetical protein